MRRSYRLGSGLAILLALTCSPWADCKVRIRYMAPSNAGAGGEALKRAIALFEAKNPDVEVSLIPASQSGYLQRYLQMNAEGNAPDVVEIDAQDSWKLVDIRIFIEDLNRYLGDGKKVTDGMLKEYVSLFSYRTFQTALPLRYEVSALAYNTTLLQESGQWTPSQYSKGNSWNWASFLSVARKLTRRRSGEIPAKADIWGYGEGAPHWTWDYWVYGNGGSLFRQDKDSPDIPRCDLSTEDALRGLQFQSDLAYRYKVTPSGGYFVDDFAAGRIGMVYGTAPMFARWRSGGATLKWGIAPFPADRKAYTRISSQGLAISRQSRRKLYAWDFVRFMAGPEAQKLLAQGDPWAVPSNLSIARSDVFAGSKANEPQQSLLQQAMKADSKRNPFGMPLPGSFQQTLTLELAESWARREAADVTVARMVPRLNAMVEDWYRKRAKRQKANQSS